MHNERREGHSNPMDHTDEMREQRKARNEALFRDANESVRAVQKDLGITEGAMPFICECEEPTCRSIIRVAQADYEAVRSDARHFIVAPGHEGGGEHVVETQSSYSVVEKDGRSAEIAEATDPRKES
jgi:hypothetical protein